ncbi:hypothetical protein [Nocardioides sp.]|uniref:hypothetical protein n=1 Tax=Nocardioides sp. TaxID=35761 RepID=UPI002B8A3C50|nr:hypothetical protein [Nocardioides sp.]HXH78679.1 hypothetical protein [Nocardioides sp.]
MSRIKNPQDKKRLSLERDRRNTYGENDKASRKNIPRAKARVNRANRRAETVALEGALGAPDETLDAIVGRRRKVWRKWTDAPLGSVLAIKRGEPSGDPLESRRLPYP